MNLGYYIVNDKQYSNKIEAIFEANKSNADIKWIFYDEVFNNIDFTIEPTELLNQLYLKRAIQLREKYDYLILFFSGGSDSVHILETFLKNNIKLDEIVVGYPESGLSNYNFNNVDTSASNNISEYLYTTKPYLNKIKQKYPNLKITLHDYFIDMLNYKSNDWLVRASDWIHPTTTAKFDLSRYSHLDNILENKTIGAIYGIEKPIVIYAPKYEKYYYVLSDTNINGAVMPKNHPNMHVELFYITPDMPELLIKQAHTIVKQCETNNNLKKYVTLLVQATVPKDTISFYQTELVPIIYPDISIGFQTKKASTTFMVESDDWFYTLHKDSKLYQLIMTDYNNLINSLDEKYLVKNNNVVTSLVKHYKYYHLSNLKKITQGSNSHHLPLTPNPKL